MINVMSASSAPPSLLFCAAALNSQGYFLFLLWLTPPPRLILFYSTDLVCAFGGDASWFGGNHDISGLRRILGPHISVWYACSVCRLWLQQLPCCVKGDIFVFLFLFLLAWRCLRWGEWSKNIFNKKSSLFFKGWQYPNNIISASSKDMSYAFNCTSTQFSYFVCRFEMWKLIAKELMLLNYDVGEDSWESLGLQGDPTSPSEGDRPWDFFGRNDAEAETPVLWPPHVKSWLIGKDSDAGRDWGQEEKGTTEDEMAGWHHWLDGREFEWTPGVVDGQGGLACCNSWRHKESDMTERLNWTELNVQKSLRTTALAG